MHLAEVVALPGFVAARRYRYTDAQLAGYPENPQKYLALYWIDGDPAAALDLLAEAVASGKFVVPDHLDGAATLAANFSPIGDTFVADGMTEPADLAD